MASSSALALMGSAVTHPRAAPWSLRLAVLFFLEVIPARVIQTAKVPGFMFRIEASTSFVDWPETTRRAASRKASEFLMGFGVDVMSVV